MTQHTTDTTTTTLNGVIRACRAECSITLLLDGRENDDDDVGGILVDHGDSWLRVEDARVRQIFDVDRSRIECAWATDANGNVLAEFERAPRADVVAYAVHVDGALWDDADISAWCEDIRGAAVMMEKAEAFFDEDPMPLLTIVRAEFTPDEWAKVQANGWTLT